MSYETQQEEFWAGDFGDEYIARNRSDQLLASNRYWFSQVLAITGTPGSVLELGANVGMNLRALRSLLPNTPLDAVEINEKAASDLSALEYGQVTVGSILDLALQRSHDLVFTKTVLIHIDPDRLSQAYDAMAACAKRHVLIAEYYNPSPVEIGYRGHRNRLFKRDFAGEFLDQHNEF